MSNQPVFSPFRCGRIGVLSTLKGIAGVLNCYEKRLEVMKDTWKKKQKAQEEDFFDKREKEILNKLRSKLEKSTTPEEQEDKSQSPVSEKKERNTQQSWDDDLL